MSRIKNFTSIFLDYFYLDWVTFIKVPIYLIFQVIPLKGRRNEKAVEVLALSFIGQTSSLHPQNRQIVC